MSSGRISLDVEKRSKEEHAQITESGETRMTRNKKHIKGLKRARAQKEVTLNQNNPWHYGKEVAKENLTNTLVEVITKDDSKAKSWKT